MKKIVIVCAHYMPNTSYIEENLAQYLQKNHFDVTVVTSNKSNFKKNDKRVFPIGNSIFDNIKIIRLKSNFQIGSTVISQGICNAIIKINPDLIIVIGIAKLFPYPVYKLSPKYDIISYFGENSDFYVWNTIKAFLQSIVKKIIRNLIKKHFYQKAINNSIINCLYTPETELFLKKLINTHAFNKLKLSSYNSSLGFNKINFFFDIDGRDEIRKYEGINNSDFILITVTRYSPSKSIEWLCDRVISLNKQGFNLKYWIIGFNTQESVDIINNYVCKTNAENYIKIFPFMDHQTLCKYLSAADMGVWCQVTISIQQAMGSGLYVLLENKESVKHLLDSNNGQYFTKDIFEQLLINQLISYSKTNQIEQIKNRSQIEIANNLHFSNDVIFSKIISQYLNLRNK